MAKRGKIPTLIAAFNGKPTKVTVKRKRRCSRCSSELEKDSKCFVIPNSSGGYSNKRPYCVVCFKEVLGQTRRDLDDLEKLLT